MERHEDEEPIYVISVVARLLKTHPQTLRYYERLGLVEPARPQGRIRLYSARDVARVQLIQRLVGELGVNLAGVEVIMNLTERLAQLEQDLQEMRELVRTEAQRARRQGGAEGI